MYKTRLLAIVVAIVILALTFTPIPKIFSAPADGITLNTYYLDTKKSIESELNRFKGSLKMNSSTIDLADNLITNRKQQYIPEKFSKYKSISIGYSPVVMAMPKSAMENAEKHFVVSRNSLGLDTYNKSMRDILIKCANSTKEKGVSASDIGVSGDKSYKVIIPGPESPYRKVVIDSIIMELLNGKEPTNDSIEEIKPLLDKVIDNSYTTLDIEGVLKEISSSSYILIFPEHILAEMESSVNIVYSKNVVCEQIYMYYDKEIEGYIEGFISGLKKSPVLANSFGYKVGYRVSGLEQSQSKPYEYTADVVNNILVPDSLSKLMGDNYWEGE